MLWIRSSIQGGYIFDQLSHLAEYTINKTFGDYENPKKLLDGRVIVTLSKEKDYYYTQNIVFATILTVASGVATRILSLKGYPNEMTVPLFMGGMLSVTLFALYNMSARHRGCYGSRWVVIDSEKHGINTASVEEIKFKTRVYASWADAPSIFPGTDTDPDQDLGCF